MTTPVYIEQAVAAALGASPEITALCGDRIYPFRLPKEAILPAVVYRRVDSAPAYTLLGYSSEAVTLAVSSFAQVYEGAKELALAVRGVMAAPSLNAILLKEADLDDKEIETPCVIAEYLCQQSGGHYHG